MILLVGRGLLGGGIERRLVSQRRAYTGVAVTWDDPDLAVVQLLDSAARIAATAGDAGWQLAWSAGAGVVGTTEPELEAEVTLLASFLERLERPPRALLLASSAGGVYAGATEPPFTERHEAAPLSAYGHAKLATEAACARLSRDRGTRVAVARFANLYGPDQDLAKAQGLVSQLCLSRVTGRPVRLHVPLDTLRDYVYADDAAAVAVDMLDRVDREPETTVVTKIVASGHAASVSEVVAAATKAFRRRVPLVQAVVDGGPQVRDLRLRSVVWTDLDLRVGTPLVVGLRATAEGVAARHREARLAQVD